MKNTGLIIAIIYILAIIGEVRCIYKTVTCNWEPIGKAEIIYTAASLTGMGAVIGWLNIEDK
jgi:hypothetical protein|tara:strand:- start:373 stop:558 length:186 start_codon:yes stop_codon:yes gene_type:complete